MSKDKRIQFHVPWPKYREIDLMAQEKGLTIDNMARTAMYQFIVRNSKHKNKHSIIFEEGEISEEGEDE